MADREDMDGMDVDEEEFRIGDHVLLILMDSDDDMEQTTTAVVGRIDARNTIIDAESTGFPMGYLAKYRLETADGATLFDDGKRLVRMTPKNLVKYQPTSVGRFPPDIIDTKNGAELLELAVKLRDARSVQSVLESKKPLSLWIPHRLDVVNWLVTPHPKVVETNVPQRVSAGRSWEDHLEACGFQSLVECLRPVFGRGREDNFHALLRKVRAMHMAAKNGDILLFVFMLLNDKEPLYSDNPQYVVDDNGQTPLHIIARYGHSKILRALNYHAPLRGRRINDEEDGLNTWLRNPDDLLVRDRNGDTAEDLCQDELTRAALSALQEEAIPRFILAHLLRDQWHRGHHDVDLKKLDRLAELVDLSGWFTGRRWSKLVCFVASVGNVAVLRWALHRIGHSIYMVEGSSGIPVLESALSIQRNKDRGLAAAYTRAANDIMLARCQNRSVDSIFEDILAHKARSECDDRGKSWNDRLREGCLTSPTDHTPEDVMGTLVRHGATMIPFKEIVHCFPLDASKKLISYRLQVHRLIEKRFEDPVPVAIDRIMGYLCSPDQEDMHATPSSLAFLCVKRHGWETNFRDMYQSLLLKWLVERYGLNPVTMRNADGETLLHEAVRSKLMLTSVWLAQNFNELARTHGRTSRKLPVHIALESVSERDVANAFKMVNAIAGFTEGTTWSWFEANNPTLAARTDRDGRTVASYALACRDPAIVDIFRDVERERSFVDLMKMIRTAKPTWEAIVAATRQHDIHDYVFRDVNHAYRLQLFLICCGYDDLIDAFASAGNDPSAAYRVALEYGSNRFPFLKRIICHPTMELLAGDWVEMDVDTPERALYGEVMKIRGGEVLLGFHRFLDGRKTGEEWTPSDSTRINRSSILMLKESYRTSGLHSKKKMMTVKEFATRAGYSGLLAWIEAAERVDRFANELHGLERDLLDACLRDSADAGTDIEATLKKASTLMARNPEFSNHEAITGLRSTLYVLGACWRSWPRILSGHDIGSSSNLLVGVASHGCTHSLRWILAEKVDRTADADVLFQAMLQAAESNQVSTMILLKQFGARFEETDVNVYLRSAFEDCAVGVVNWILSLDSSYANLLDSFMLDEAWYLFCDEEAENEEDAENALELVELLLSNGVRFSTYNRRGIGSLLHFRCRADQNEELCAKVWPLLNRYGVDFVTPYENGARKYNRRPQGYIFGLREAVERVICTERLYNLIATQPVDSCKPEEVEALAKKSNVNLALARTRVGRSLLHAAIVKNNIEIAQWMVQSKTTSLSVPVDAESGVLPRELAQQAGNGEMVSMFDELLLGETK